MKLLSPIIITPRLMAGLKIGDSFVSIQDTGRNCEGRTIYRYHIDTPEFEYTNNDLRSDIYGGTLQEGLETLLAFLGACAESGDDGENSDLFPINVREWANHHDDELAMLRIDLEENQNLITE